MENVVKTNSIVNILYALSTGFLCVSPLNISLFNYLFRIPALLIIVYLVLMVYQYETKKYTSAFLGLFAVFIFHFFVDTPFTVDIMLSTVSILLYLSLIVISDKVSLNIDNIRFINKCSIFTAFVLIAYSLSPMARLASYEGDVFTSPYLTYGFDNSNYAGILTFLVFSSLFITRQAMGGKTKKINLLLCLVLLYLIYETNTRSALAAAILVAFAEIIFYKRKMPQWLLLLLCSIPFAFVPVYLNLSNSGAIDDVEVMGKSVMSGRAEVFENFIKTLSDSFYWALGNLKENTLKNAHNGPLAILASCGILGFISYFYIFLSRIYNANKKVANVTNKVAVFVLVACFVNTSGEAALLLGGFPIITYLFIFSVLSYSRQSYDTK